MAKKVSYEEMIKELEGIVKLMDSEELSLDDAIKNYEKGIKLYNKLNSILSTAEGKIKIIKDNEEKDFLDERD
ncbi:exodeoxyribonuclease VII small subunit [Clostridium sp. KNHs214]|uniref:exodeoxyribonuclease VII small subunit n=1 Tax=Clostridium sp. KNHs214 TaxID=1540257 RepID=UPI0005546DEA|nr:exodeoxyribonuclease VII small subunit [Clostridium sp. KNHs214]